METMKTDEEQGFDAKADKIYQECLRSGEPVIIFRAKDILTTMVVAHYQYLLETYIPEDYNFQARLAEKAEEIRKWQRNHPSLVHLPD